MDRRSSSGRRVALCSAFALSLIVPACLASAAQVVGPAHITDGDTVRIGKVRIRLHGIDAPEKAQSCSREGAAWRCGLEARAALEAMVGGRPLVCEVKDRDRYGRVVGECFAGSRNLNRAMVAEGWALAYRAYASDYVTDEAAARRERRGVWSGHFEMPWDWRKARRGRKRQH